jgi:hypothetical protein
LVITIRDQGVATNGNYQLRHYSITPRTEASSAIRMTTPL